jgi:hypothetical protein
MAQVVAQVERPCWRDTAMVLIRLPEGELHTMRIEQAEFRRAARVISGDDEVEIGWHSACPFIAHST